MTGEIVDGTALVEIVREVVAKCSTAIVAGRNAGAHDIFPDKRTLPFLEAKHQGRILIAPLLVILRNEDILVDERQAKGFGEFLSRRVESPPHDHLIALQYCFQFGR